MSASTTTIATTATMTATTTTPSTPAPQRPRQRRRTKTDPFFELPATPPRNPAASEQQDGESEHEEPLLYKAIMTPILFTSFLISLFLINRRDLVRRATNSSRSPTANSTSYFSPRAWLLEDPYQDPRLPPTLVVDDRHAASSPTAPHVTRPHRPQGWFYHTRRVAMAKLEIGDALDLRRRVIVAMLVAAMACAGVCYWSLIVLYRRFIAS